MTDYCQSERQRGISHLRHRTPSPARAIFQAQRRWVVARAIVGGAVVPKEPSTEYTADDFEESDEELDEAEDEEEEEEEEDRPRGAMGRARLERPPREGGRTGGPNPRLIAGV